MPEQNIEVPTAPEAGEKPEDRSALSPVEPVVPAPEVTPEEPAYSPPPSDTEQRQQARENIYQKYYGERNPPASAPEEESTPLPVTTPVEVKPPEVVPNPVATPVVTPQSDNDIRQELAALKELLLQQQATKLAPTTPPPAAPYVPESAPVEERDWIDYYRDGDSEAGIKALAKQIGQQNKEQVTAESQAAMLQTIEMLEARKNMEMHATRVRDAHPELASMQDVFNAALNHDIETAKNSGLVKTYDELAKFYQERLDSYVLNANKIAQLNRAAGANDASVREQEVISSTVLKPQDISNSGERPTAPTEPPKPGDPIRAYMEMRRKQQARRDRIPAPRRVL